MFFGGFLQQTMTIEKSIFLKEIQIAFTQLYRGNTCFRMREIHIKIVGMLGGRGGGSPPEPAPRDPHLDHIHRAVLVARWANPQIMPK